MWTCPACKHKFYNKNQSHSCGEYSVDGFLEGKSEKATQLFHHFITEYKTIGNFELHPVKTRVALLTLMRFASINKMGPDYLDGHLVLVEEMKDPAIFYRIDNLNNRFFVHHFRVYKAEDISNTFKKYMAMAYRVGQREHVK